MAIDGIGSTSPLQIRLSRAAETREVARINSSKSILRQQETGIQQVQTSLDRARDEINQKQREVNAARDSILEQIRSVKRAEDSIRDNQRNSSAGQEIVQLNLDQPNVSKRDLIQDPEEDSKNLGLIINAKV